MKQHPLIQYNFTLPKQQLKEYVPMEEKLDLTLAKKVLKKFYLKKESK